MEMKRNFSDFYHPNTNATMCGHYRKASAYDQQYQEFPGIFKCARTGIPIVMPRGMYSLVHFASIALLPICVDRFCMYQTMRGSFLSSITYGFVIPCGLFSWLCKVLKGSFSWETIKEDSVSLKEASELYLEERRKERLGNLLRFLFISLPLSTIIIWAHYSGFSL